MARLKLDLPEKFHFSTDIPIRISDLNYGGHVGNDSVLTIMHEARVQFLKHYNYTELDIEGAGIIMVERQYNINLRCFTEISYGLKSL